MCARSVSVPLAALLVACGSPPLTPRDPDPGVPHFKIQTFNVEFQHSDDPATVEAIGHADADIVCLQEVTPAWEAVIRAKYSEQYPYMLFRPLVGTGGLAALSKYVLDDYGILPAPDGSHPSWHLSASSPMGDIQLLNVHLRSIFASKSNVIDAASAYFTVGGDHQREIKDYVAAMALGAPLIALGDFNEEPDGEAVRYLEQQGLRDILFLYHPGQPTWRNPPAWQFEQTLDHILFNDAFEPLNAWVENRGNSDHIPVVAHLEAARR